MKLISLTLPGGNTINPPSGIPQGGLEAGGAGQSLIQLAITFIFTLGMVLSVAFLILAGIQWITSAGEKEKIQKARARITYSIIGLIVIVSTFFIVNVVFSFFGGRPSFNFNPNSNISPSVSCADFCKDFPPYAVCPITSSQQCVCGTTDVTQCSK